MKMRTLKIVLPLLFLSLAACNTHQEPQEPSELSAQFQKGSCDGRIIATLGCYDEETSSTYYQGYIIETTDNDTILSFYLNSDIPSLNAISVPYGETVLSQSISIPYTFSYAVIFPDDKRFIHFAPIIQDAMRPCLSTPLEKIKQVIITRNE